MADERSRSKPARPQGQQAVEMLRRLGPASILALAWVSLPAIFGFTLLANMEPAAAAMADWPTWQRVVVYSGFFAVTAGLGLLPTYAQALFGGYLFRSLLLGVPAALTGFAVASAIGYVLARRVGAERVQAELARHPKADVVRRALLGRGFWPTLGVITLVRIPPNSPFALTNLVLSTSGVPLGVYLLGTLIGMAPRTAIVVWLGTQIQTWSEQERPGWYLVAAIASTIVVLMVLSSIANKAIDRYVRAGVVDPLPEATIVQTAVPGELGEAEKVENKPNGD